MIWSPKRAGTFLNLSLIDICIRNLVQTDRQCALLSFSVLFSTGPGFIICNTGSQSPGAGEAGNLRLAVFRLLAGVKSPESQVGGRSVAARWAAEAGWARAGREECNVPYSSVPLLRSETLTTRRRHLENTVHSEDIQRPKFAGLQYCSVIILCQF